MDKKSITKETGSPRLNGMLHNTALIAVGFAQKITDYYIISTSLFCIKTNACHSIFTNQTLSFCNNGTSRHRKFFLGLSLWLIIFSSLFIFFGFLFIWKSCICYCAKILGWVGGPKLIPMGVRDVLLATQILPEDSGVDSCSIGFMLRIHGNIDISELRKHLINTFPRWKKGQFKYDRLFYTIQQFMGYSFFRELKCLNVQKQFRSVELAKGELQESYLVTWLKEPYPNGNAGKHFVFFANSRIEIGIIHKFRVTSGASFLVGGN